MYISKKCRRQCRTKRKKLAKEVIPEVIPRFPRWGLEFFFPSGFCFLVQIRTFVIQNTLGLQNWNMKENTKLQSQSKWLGFFGVSFSHQCWCTRYLQSVSPPVQYISGKIHSLRNNARSFDSSVVHSLNPIRRKLFLILRNVVIKETKTSFLYWLSSLFLSVKSLMFFPEKMAPKRAYTCLAISRH